MIIILAYSFIEEITLPVWFVVCKYVRNKCSTDEQIALKNSKASKNQRVMRMVNEAYKKEKHQKEKKIYSAIATSKTC